MSPEAMNQMSPEVAAGMGIGVLIVYVVAWVFLAFCMAKIGQKCGFQFKTGLIMSLIPIANIIFMLQVAAKPLWWIFLMLIPIVNIVIVVLVWMAIAEKRGKPGWWGILMLVPIVNIVIIITLAFGE